MGAAVLAVEVDHPVPRDIATCSYLLLGAALYGLHRATRSKLLFVLPGLVGLAWVTAHLRTLAGGATAVIRNDGLLQDLPEVASHLGLCIALVVAAWAVRDRVGRGLALVTGVPLALALLALLVWMPVPRPVADQIQEASFGWLRTGMSLSAVCWCACAAPSAEEPSFEPRGLAALAAAALLVGSVFGPAGGALPLLGTLIRLGSWVGVLLASALLLHRLRASARAERGAPELGLAAWAGVGLLAVQVLITSLEPLFLLLGRTEPPLPFVGTFALGLVALGTPALPHRGLRTALAVILLVTGGLALQASLGALLQQLRDEHHPTIYLLRTMGPLSALPRIGWAAYLAYLAAPPVLARVEEP